MESVEPTSSDAAFRAHLDAGRLGAAATELVRRHGADVHGLCRAMLRDPTLAEDVTQDVFERAFSALPGFRREASPRTWLLKIARNRCIDSLRRAGKDPAPLHDEEAVPETPDDAADPLRRMTSQAELRSALDLLEGPDRALIVLRYGHGFGYPELAEAFGLRQGTVRMRVSRALARIRARPSALASAASPAALASLPGEQGEAAIEPVAGGPAGPSTPASAPAAASDAPHAEIPMLFHFPSPRLLRQLLERASRVADRDSA